MNRIKRIIETDIGCIMNFLGKTNFFGGTLSSQDPEIFDSLERELGRQRNEIELIASENIVSRAVLEAQGSVMTNKYAEGYSGRRYYGGCDFVDKVENINRIKSERLYQEIERNSIFTCPVNKEDRSEMNIPFIFTDNGDENEFLKFCADRGLLALKGHRSVGGFRASIYNAMPIDGIDALILAMQDYESHHSK